MNPTKPRQVNWLAAAAGALAVIGGPCLFVYGGYDDSPGAQLLGLVIAVAGVYGLVRAFRPATRR
jgi:hypothetical protein